MLMKIHRQLVAKVSPYTVVDGVLPLTQACCAENINFVQEAWYEGAVERSYHSQTSPQDINRRFERHLSSNWVTATEAHRRV